MTDLYHYYSKQGSIEIRCKFFNIDVSEDNPFISHRESHKSIEVGP
jgi:hypothetical protein